MSSDSKHRLTALLSLVAVLILALTAGGMPLAAQRAPIEPGPSPAVPGDDFRSSPVMFIENAGQWPEAARFQVWPSENDQVNPSFLSWYVWGPIYLSDIAVLSAEDAWGVGSNGTIRHWNGREWIQVASPTNGFLQAVAFASPSDGWAVGNGIVIRWNGSQWQTFTRGILGTYNLFDVAMLSPNKGWAVGVKGWWPGSAGEPLMLAWNGVTWQEVSLPGVTTQDDQSAESHLIIDAPAIPSPNSLNSIAIVSPTDAWVVGAGGRIYRWNGVSWNRVSSPTQTHIQSVSMASPYDGWAVSGSLYGHCQTMLRWNGYAWRLVSCPVSTELYDLFMIAPSDGWAVGTEGTILHWDGTRWSRVSSPTGEGLTTVVMASATDGWITGQTNILRYGVPPNTKWTISGRVTDASGAGIPSVTVSAGSSLNTTTDANGNYTFTGLTAGTYNISPSRYLYAFSPSSRTVTVPPDATGQNFVQTPVVDLTVNRIEVAQVFIEQNDPISGTLIPLIAGKDTLVRVYVGVSGATSVGGVSARLHIRQPDGTETVDSHPVNVWPVQAKQTPDPFSLQDTINFRPATKLLQGKVTFWAEVDPENRIPETDEDHNTGGHVSKTFEAGKPVRIGVTQIGYRSFPWGPYAYADWNTIARADAMLRQVYPVSAGDVQYYYQPGEPARVQCLWGDQDACWAEFHNQLKAFWRRVDDEGKWVGRTRPHALVGWVPGAAREAGGTCGQANRVSPREVVIADYCDKYMGNPPALTPQPVTRVLAHEVGHLLNTKPELKHAKNLSNRDDPQCNAEPEPDSQDPLYPTPPSYPRGSIFAHGLDIDNLQVLEPNKAPLATYDLMTYCSPVWISPYNYFKLNTGFTDAASAQGSNAEPDAPVRKLLVSGLVFTPTLQVELNPFYVLNTASAADADSGADYCLEARNASNVVLAKRCFNLAFLNCETYAPASVDGFALAIPYPAGTTQIVLTHRGTPIAMRPVSAHAPAVRLVSPNGGENWTGSGTHTVTWTASDQDGDTLHFALAYSTDGGASWIPAGSDLTGTQHALDVSMLPGGTSVLLRISATDGVNTTDDVSDAPFMVGRKAPMAFILSPEDDARFFPGQAIWLEGRAFDLEDGTLPDSGYRWTSNRDGDLGTDATNLVILSPGPHVITLTATDSDGNRATATVRLWAGSEQFMPLISRNR